MPDDESQEQGSGEEQGQEQGQEQFESREQGQEQDVIPRSALPPELRDLPPEQISSATQALVATLQSRNEEVEELRQRAYGQPAGPPQEEEEEELPEVSDEELKDMILEDPEQALDYYIRKKGYDKRIRQIESLAVEGVQTSAFAQAQSALPEFEEYQEEVRNLLQSSGAPANFQNIKGAYLMARGAKSLADVQKKRGGKVTSEPPSPPEPKEETPELTDAEERARKAFGLSKEEYLRGKNERVEVMPPGIEE